MQIRRYGDFSVRKSRAGGFSCDEHWIRKNVARWTISWRKWLPRPRQSARCPASSGGSIGSEGAQFLTKIYFSSRGWYGWHAGQHPAGFAGYTFLTKIRFSSRGLGRVPAGSDLSDIPDFNFVTKVEFSSRGLSGGSAGRYLIAQRQSVFLTKIAPVFAWAARRCAVRNWLAGLALLSSRTRFCPLVYVSFSRNIRSWGGNVSFCTVGACPCLLREYVRCPIGMIFSFTAHQILYTCLFRMPNLPFLWIWLSSSHIDMTSAFPIDMTIIWWIYNGCLMDLFSDTIRLDMTSVPIALIWFFPLSYWYDDPNGFFNWFEIDLLQTRSYWYDQRWKLSYRNDRILVLIWWDGKGIFYPLLSLNPTVIFLVIDTENLKVILSKRESSLYLIWPFILGIENTLDLTGNPRPKTLNFLSFQSDRRFVKKNLLKSV